MTYRGIPQTAQQPIAVFCMRDYSKMIDGPNREQFGATDAVDLKPSVALLRNTVTVKYHQKYRV